MVKRVLANTKRSTGIIEGMEFHISNHNKRTEKSYIGSLKDKTENLLLILETQNASLDEVQYTDQYPS